MKKLATATLALAFAFAPSAFAAKLKNIKHLSNESLEKLSEIANAEKALTQGTVKIITPTPARGRSAAEVRQATVAQAAHQLCAFFDDGVSLGKAGAEEAINNLADQSLDDKSIAKMSSTLKEAQGDKIEIYSGSASGNNTVGTVVGVYDLANNEILVIANTNCGSDD